MKIVKAALSLALETVKITCYERFLFFSPHPDDIEIGAGATVSLLSSMNKKIRFVICTDGRYGSDVIKEEELIEIRRKEALLSASILGVDDVVFLPFSDGALYDKEELKRAMAEEISSFKPDIIFAPDPAVINEAHQDHLNVGVLARELSYFAPFDDIMKKYGCSKAPLKAIAFYMTAKPNTYVRTKGHIREQFEALCAHESQKESLKGVYTYLRLRSVLYGIKRLSFGAEAFRAYTAERMHCLPELGE